MSYFPILIQNVRDGKMAVITHPNKLPFYTFKVIQCRVKVD
jgi:hypothetical protein